MTAIAAPRLAPPLWLGIDFSGDHLQWRARGGAAAVWIASIAYANDRLTLRDVRRVQDLPGDGAPFARLAEFLRAGAYTVCGIDAPFAPPAGHAPASRSELLRAVADIPCGRRPFPTGAQLVGLLAPALAPRGRHVMRETERRWRGRGVNTRSVTWNGPRGGAPFAAACLRLIAASKRPVWPWAPATAPGLLAEVFPAGQLKAWGLPHDRYNGDDALARLSRATILSGIVRRSGLRVPPRLAPRLHDSADALDSVVCALAARAVTTDALLDPPGRAAADEGWIAAHR